MNKCCIFGAGDYGEMKLSNVDLKECFIIAADAGLEYIRENGLTPDLIIGDYDSLNYIPQEKNVIILPETKDDTDMLAAIKSGLARGFKEFVLYGGLGGRLDHTLANIQSLAFITANRGFGYLVSDDTVITVLEDEAVEFDSFCTGNISVFSLGDRCRGVNIRGLKYELQNAEITCEFPVGVSNEFIGNAAVISLQSGRLVVMWQNHTAISQAGLFPKRAYRQ